jgi:hypothetical protein
MENALMNKKYLVWLIMVSLISTLACSLLGGGGSESAASNVSLGESEPAEVAAPIEAPVIEDVEEVNAAEPEAEPVQPETIAFTGVTGLDQLASYRIAFVMDFDGTSGGQPSVGRVEMILESSSEPPARHLALQMEGTTVESTGGANRTEFYEIDNKIYLYNEALGTGQWISMESDAESAEVFGQGFFAPDEELELPDTVQCDTLPETVNDVSTTRCTFTELDVPSEEATYDSLTGNVWITDEGYIVRYTLEAQGYRSLEQGAGMFEYGDATFQYDLTQINADLSSTLPDEARKATSFDFGGGAQDTGEPNDTAADNFPVLDNATDMFSAAGVTSYYTPSDVATVADFYRQNLSDQGWLEAADSTFSTDNSTMLSFENEGRTLTIVITEESQARINVSLIE